MFFNTVCFSFKVFKYVIQKLKDPKKNLKDLPAWKNLIWPNFKLKDVG